MACWSPTYIQPRALQGKMSSATAYLVTWLLLQSNMISLNRHISKHLSRPPHSNIHTPRGTTSFPEDIQAYNAPLMWPLLHQQKRSVVSNSTEGYSGRKEEEEEEWKKVCGPRRGLYFHVTHYCESVIWRLLKQDYSGQTETTRNPQVCVCGVYVCLFWSLFADDVWTSCETPDVLREVVLEVTPM